MEARVKQSAPAPLETREAAAGPPDATKAQRQSQVAMLLTGLGVLALCVFLHLYRLSAAPGWDPQEGYNLDLAWNLLHGHLRLFGLTSAFAQHPPLFYLQLALLIHIFGYSMTTLRLLVACYAILTCAAVLAFGWRLLGPGPALWAAIYFTCAPLILANTRWGYSYAQLMLVGVLCLWALWEYAKTRSRGWLGAAALLAGLGVLSDYEGVALVALVLLAVLYLRPRDAALAASLAVGLPLAGMLVCFAVAPTVFLADLGDTLGRAAGGSVALALVDLVVNYYRFATLDVWVLLGLVGLFLVPERRARALLLAAMGVVGLVVLKVREIGPSFHTAVPLLPLLALGAGVALHVALRQLYAWVVRGLSVLPAGAQRAGGHTAAQPYTLLGRLAEHLPERLRRVLVERGRNSLAALVVFMVVVSPVAIALAADIVGITSTLHTENDRALALSPNDAQAAAAYILSHAHNGDVTLGSPQVVWMLDQPDGASGKPRAVYAADILQALAYDGQAAAFYSAGLPHTRWAFDVSVGHARFVIVDNLVRSLAAPDEVPALAHVLAVAESWPIVFQRGEYTIYQRPPATPTS